MATLHSFETTCHLEAIERDLIDVLIESGMVEFLRADVQDLEFHKLLSEMADESVGVVATPTEVTVSPILGEIAEVFKDINLK